MSSSVPARGRPRADLDARAFAATLETIDELGYSGATMDRIAAAVGIAKTTLYRRWASKGELVVESVVDALGPLPEVSPDIDVTVPAAVRWLAQRISEPGVGAAFAGVFSDAVTDPPLRQILLRRLQDPYRTVLQDALAMPEERILLYVDVVVGTLLHRLGISGATMVEADIDELIEIILAGLRRRAEANPSPHRTRS